MVLRQFDGAQGQGADAWQFVKGESRGADGAVT